MSLRLFLSLIMAYLPSQVPDDLGALPPEARAGWQSIRAAVASDVRGHFHHEREVRGSDNVPKNDAPRTIEFAVGSVGSYLKYDLGGKTDVAAFNKDYFFDAGRLAPDTPFVLGNVRQGPDYVRMQYLVRDEWEPFLFAGCELCGKSLLELIVSERFTLHSLSIDNAMNTAVMTFGYARGDKVGEPALTGGTVTFSLVQHWAVTAFHYTTVWGHVEGTVRHRPFMGSFVPELWEERLCGKKGRSTVQRFELQDIERLEPDAPLAVRLEDYGLSMPEASPVKGTRHRLSYLINIVLFGALGAVAYLLRRVRRAAGHDA